MNFSGWPRVGAHMPTAPQALTGRMRRLAVAAAGRRQLPWRVSYGLLWLVLVYVAHRA
jgi:hypothetical protein